jgi:RNA polymerase sigma-70 factor (ECF subfamily)
LRFLKFIKRGEKQEDDKELLRKIACGEKAAEERLCCKYRQKVLFVIHERLGYVNDDEDICQDILTIIVQGARKGNIEYLASFVHSVCSNHITDWLRKRYRNKEISFDDVKEGGTEIFQDCDTLEKLIGEEERKFIDEAIKELSEKEIEILRLKYEEELSSNDIARALNITPETTRKTAERARKKIWNKLRMSQNQGISDIK